MFDLETEEVDEMKVDLIPNFEPEYDDIDLDVEFDDIDEIENEF